MASDPTQRTSRCNDRSVLSRLLSWLLRRSPPIPVQLISRNQCPLCEEARETLHRLARPLGFAVSESKIDDDPALAEAYELEVPVVLVDGQRHAFGSVDPQRLKSAIEAARRARKLGP